MPIFEFRCRKCGKEFEKIVLSSGMKIACPKCASGKVDKRMSVFSAKTSAGFTPSSGGSGCRGCASKNCGSCR